MTPLEAELTAALEGSQRQVAEFRQENEFLRRKTDALVKRIFGARSEKIDPAQLELFMAGLDPAEGTPPAATGDSLTKSPVVAPPASRPKPVRRPRLPEHLPIVEEFVDPDIVLANPAGFRFVNQVVTEQLDFVRGHFLRRHIIRRKYAPIGNSEAAPIIAPLSILQERCLAAPGLLASIITGKYCDALPLFRQE